MQPVTIKPGRSYCGARVSESWSGRRCGDLPPAESERRHPYQCEACMRASQTLARRMSDALDGWEWRGRSSAWEECLAFSLCLAALLTSAADRAVAALGLPVGRAPSPPLTEEQLARLRGIGQRLSVYPAIHPQPRLLLQVDDEGW